MPPVRDEQHREARHEPEQPAAREGRELHHEEKREQQHQTVAPSIAAVEPQVHGEQNEQRDRQLDRQVVRVAGERVRPVDALTLDGAVDVDLARAAGERRQDGRIEVAAGR